MKESTGQVKERIHLFNQNSLLPLKVFRFSVLNVYAIYFQYIFAVCFLLAAPLRSRGLASNLVLYNTANGAAAQATKSFRVFQGHDVKIRMSSVQYTTNYLKSFVQFLYLCTHCILKHLETEVLKFFQVKL